MTDFWFFLPKGYRKPYQVPEAQFRDQGDFFETAEKQNKGKLYSVTAYNPVEAAQNLKDALDKAREYRKKWRGSNPHDPPYYARTRDKGFRVVRFTDEQAAIRSREIEAEQSGKARR
jgi:hypothetical protein